MKKITMYELLNRVKGGKAPKRFIKEDMLFIYNEENKHYSSHGVGLYGEGIVIAGLSFSNVNDEIELLEEDKKGSK